MNFGGICRLEKTNKNSTAQLSLDLFCLVVSVIKKSQSKQAYIIDFKYACMQTFVHSFYRMKIHIVWATELFDL